MGLQMRNLLSDMLSDSTLWCRKAAPSAATGSQDERASIFVTAATPSWPATTHPSTCPKASSHLSHAPVSSFFASSEEKDLVAAPLSSQCRRPQRPQKGRRLANLHRAGQRRTTAFGSSSPSLIAGHSKATSRKKTRAATSFLPEFITDLLGGKPDMGDLQSIMDGEMSKYMNPGGGFPPGFPGGDSDVIIPDPYSFRTCHRQSFTNCDYHYEIWGTKFKCDGPNKERCRPLAPVCYDSIVERKRKDAPAGGNDPEHTADIMQDDRWNKLWYIRDPRLGFYANSLMLINHSYKNTKNRLFEEVRDAWMSKVRPFPVLFQKFDCTDPKVYDEICKHGGVPLHEDSLALTKLDGEHLQHHWKRFVVPLRKVKPIVRLFYDSHDKGSLAKAFEDFHDAVEETTVMVPGKPGEYLKTEEPVLMA
ncbi:unnamed protein product [Amoebophrya sp. A120]|nr:unnamed protein product [Amoebophrya sp. A120]|eukprot:GSA120T00003905001.1